MKPNDVTNNLSIELSNHGDVAFDYAAVGIAQVAPDGSLMRVNRRLEQMLGYTTAALLTHKYRDLIDPDDREQAANVARRVQDEPLHALISDGSRLNVEVSVVPVLDAQGALASSVVTWHDVTKQHHKQQAQWAHAEDLSLLARQLMAKEQQTAQRLATALHDRLGQALAAARMNLSIIASAPHGDISVTLRDECQQIDNLLDQAIHGVRQMLSDLRPPNLIERGLIAALDSEVRAQTPAHGATDLLLEIDEASTQLRWPPDVEYNAFMIAREAVTNAIRHADASLIRVLVSGNRQTLCLEVIDDGRAIRQTNTCARAPRPGIAAMHERARALQAHLTVTEAHGGGTHVSLRWSATP